MISPSPYSNFEQSDNTSKYDLGYGDYYACHDYIEQTKKGNRRYIIIIGELGASDGSEGIYKYMIEHPSLKIAYRIMLISCFDIFGGPLEKELFIFEINK